MNKFGSTEFSEKSHLKKSLLFCGILSSLFYLATDGLASYCYEGYNYLDQFYSELLATGAPTRIPMLLSGIVYNLLVAAFAIGVWTSAGPKRTKRITGSMMMGYAVLSMLAILPLWPKKGQDSVNAAIHDQRKPGKT